MNHSKYIQAFQAQFSSSQGIFLRPKFLVQDFMCQLQLKAT